MCVLVSSDNSQSSAAGGAEGSPPASPRVPPPPHAPHLNHTAWAAGVERYVGPQSSEKSGAAPRSPRTTRARHARRARRWGRCMAHDIAHRFAKHFNMIATCDYCDKQMLFGSGLKCRECKFKCHRDCESKVPPSCGLPPEFVVAFKEKFHKESGGGGGGGTYGCASPGGARLAAGRAGAPAAPQAAAAAAQSRSKDTGAYCSGDKVVFLWAAGGGGGGGTYGCASPGGRGSLLAALAHRPRRRPQPPLHNGANGPGRGQGAADSTSNSSSCNSSTPSSPGRPRRPRPARPPPHHHHHHAKQQFHFPDTSRGVSLSGSGSTDSSGQRADSLDHSNGQDNRWPRQNSLSMKEWDIPYDELKLFEVIGKGRFGTVYRGSWHGAVAVKLLHVHSLGLHLPGDVTLDTFKHEVLPFL
ncbi:hypothetical protein ACJJTC_019307 [Scirpophaga incertulas]